MSQCSGGDCGGGINQHSTLQILLRRPFHLGVVDTYERYMGYGGARSTASSKTTMLGSMELNPPSSYTTSQKNVQQKTQLMFCGRCGQHGWCLDPFETHQLAPRSVLVVCWWWLRYYVLVNPVYWTKLGWLSSPQNHQGLTVDSALRGGPYKG